MVGAGVASRRADTTLPVFDQRGLTEYLRSQAPISVLSVQRGTGRNLCPPEVYLLVERDQKKKTNKSDKFRWHK